LNRVAAVWFCVDGWFAGRSITPLKAVCDRAFRRQISARGTAAIPTSEFTY
jgi:hypothetical protein